MSAGCQLWLEVREVTTSDRRAENGAQGYRAAENCLLYSGFSEVYQTLERLSGRSVERL